MLILWRKFIKWLRSLCIDLFILKNSINWKIKLKELALIFIKFLDLSETKSPPNSGDKIVPTVKRFKIFKRFRRKK
jgi:hypothetical protein